MTININGKDIELKHTFRSYIIYESITGKSFEPHTVTDIITYFYSVLLASKTDTDVDFDTFLDYLDANGNVLNDFVNWLAEKQKLINNFATDEKTDTEPKAKKKPAKKK